ncbi:cytochrome c oxidase subunit II [Hydrogenobacter thermophilus]|uniref:cytochrome c oxidase subunit II n=1 Tax=Hydrogenobacter thermophilus TaxID=940 RepID=UPI0030FB5D78
MRFLSLLLILVGSAFAQEVLAYPKVYWENSYKVWLIVAVVIYLVVAIPALYFMLKYRYKAGVHEEGEHIEGNTALEVVWTVIPIIIVLFLATYSFANFVKQRNAPENAMELKVVGFMWGWEFEYPNGKKVYAFFNPQNYTAPEEQKAYIPAGKPVKVILTSRDVIHSFFVLPAMVTEDAVPGRLTHLWFQINKPGEYYVLCREFCGTWHSHMFAVLKVVPEAEFNAWLSAGSSQQQTTQQ